MCIQRPTVSFWTFGENWFWRDDACDEPMGPFTTEGEARADYFDLRIGAREATRHAMLNAGMEP